MPNPYPVYPAPEGTKWEIELSTYKDKIGVSLVENMPYSYHSDTLLEVDVTYHSDEEIRDSRVWMATKNLHDKYMNFYSKRESYETTVEPTFEKTYG